MSGCGWMFYSANDLQLRSANGRSSPSFGGGHLLFAFVYPEPFTHALLFTYYITKQWAYKQRVNTAPALECLDTGKWTVQTASV